MSNELVVVIGMGQFGEMVARTLGARGREVLVLDRSEERIEDLKDAVPRAVRADCTDEGAMRALAVAEAKTAVVALGEEDFEAAVLTVALLKQLGVPQIIVRASSRTHGRIFELVGATRVVFPELQMGEVLARSLLGRGVHAYFALETGHTLAEVEVRPEWAHKSLAELELRKRYGVHVLAIRRPVAAGDGTLRDHTVELPAPTEALRTGDHLVLVGTQDAVSGLTGA